MFKFLKILSLILVIVGALNWGLVGAFRFDLVAFLFGEMSRFSRIVYCLVGLSGFLLMLIAPFCCSNKTDNI